jgi:hypothetical protein
MILDGAADTDELYERFKIYISKIIEDATSSKISKFKIKTLMPWMDYEMQKIIDTRSLWFTKYRNYPNNDVLKIEFKTQEDKCDRISLKKWKNYCAKKIK